MSPAKPEEPAAPETAIRRRLVEEALVSDQLRNAIEVLLRRGRWHSFRWNELLAETEDVRNDVALRALDCLSAFDHTRGRPLPWLLGITLNVLRERMRWHAREEKRSLPQSSCSEEQWQQILNSLSTEPHPSAEPGPVWQALARLSQEQQRVLRLRFLEDRPYSEIAHDFGINEVAARARVCRALQVLRRLLDENTQERRNGE